MGVGGSLEEEAGLYGMEYWFFSVRVGLEWMGLMRLMEGGEGRIQLLPLYRPFSKP